jgi:mycofactocin precursor
MSQLATIAGDAGTDLAEPDATAVAARPAEAVAVPAVTEVAIADLLVEEVSIDGMCGVY